MPPDEDTGAPLKVMYGIRGETDLTERTLDHLDGYMGSRPVRVGNRAHGQFQLDAFGIFVDCAEIYLRQGGHWEVAYWDLVARVADFVADNWQRPSDDIWELGVQAHWVNSRMLCWVALYVGIGGPMSAFVGTMNLTCRARGAALPLRSRSTPARSARRR